MATEENTEVVLQGEAPPPMKKYRQKRVIVEAVQLTEMTFVGTSEGMKQGNPGDWLIDDAHNLSLCKNDIFQQTYEAVEEE
jgi:hypothetical protein